MKKALCILIAMVMVLSVAGCGAAKSSSKSPASSASSASSAQSAAKTSSAASSSGKASSSSAASGKASSASSSASSASSAASSESIPSAEKLSGQKANSKYKIAVIEKNLTNPIWVALKAGAERAGQEAGADVTVLAPQTDDNNDEQISLIEEQIAKGVKALVVIPADGTGIQPAIEAANKAGIPVINGDTKINTSTCKVETFIAVENYKAAVQTAEKLSEMMNKKGNVIILEGKAGASTSVDIVKGANDVFKKYSEIKVVASQTANWNRTDGYNVTLNLLQANPDATAIFAANDEMAMGAVQAVAQAGKTGKILIAGLNAIEDAKKAVDAGTLALTCDKMGDLQGYSEVMAAVLKLNGGTLAPEYGVPTTLYVKK